MDPGRSGTSGLCGIVLLIVASATCSGAWAGAFNQPAGQGEVIFGGLFDKGDRSFDANGRHMVRTDPYTKREVAAALEYGVTDWFQVSLKPDIVSNNGGCGSGKSYTGLGTSEAGAQWRLLMFGPAVLAVQGTFQLPATTRERNLALIGNTSRNTDGRLLLGYDFTLGSWPSFLDAQTGYRIRGSGAPDETHVDLTLGVRPWANVLLLLQDFTTLPVGRGTPWFPASRSSNLEGSVVYDLSQRWSLPLGVFETVDGRDALRERGVDVAVWYRF